MRLRSLLPLLIGLAVILCFIIPSSIISEYAHACTLCSLCAVASAMNPPCALSGTQKVSILRKCHQIAGGRQCRDPRSPSYGLLPWWPCHLRSLTPPHLHKLRLHRVHLRPSRPATASTHTWTPILCMATWRAFRSPRGSASTIAAREHRTHPRQNSIIHTHA